MSIVYCLEIVVKHANAWNCNTNGCENLCHKSIQQSKSITAMYNDERRISETNDVPNASALYGVKNEH
jgi:hypothetical protein